MACKIEELKLKLKAATKNKLKNERNELFLRSIKQSLSEELSLIRREMEFASQQLEDIKQQMSQMKYQNTMIEICSESEKKRMEIYSTNINNHKNGFDDLFTKERQLLELQQIELREREAKRDEVERKKYAKIAEINEQKAKEAAQIEEECRNIEQECIILRNRNKAIMIKIRNKLIEAEGTRRKLITKK